MSDPRRTIREIIGFDAYQDVPVHWCPGCRIILWALIGFAALAYAALAYADEATPHGPPCGTVKDITDGLAEKYHEMPQIRGVTRAGNLMVLFASAGGASWSLVGVNPGGVACMLDAGVELQIEPQGMPS